MASPTSSAPRFAPLPFTASPTSRSVYCAFCATPRAWVSKLSSALRNGLIWPSSATCRKPLLLAILGRLKDRELANVLSKAGFRSAEVEAALGFEEEALEAQKVLLGRKLNAPVDAFRFLEKMPLDQIAYLMAESNKSAALSKIRAFLNKWRPVRIALPAVATELEALGMARGAKFDQIVDQVFAMQLTGRGKTPEEREKILRKLSGIKEPPKKKEKEKKASKG